MSDRIDRYKWQIQVTRTNVRYNWQVQLIVCVFSFVFWWCLLFCLFFPPPRLVGVSRCYFWYSFLLFLLCLFFLSFSFSTSPLIWRASPTCMLLWTSVDLADTTDKYNWQTQLTNTTFNYMTEINDRYNWQVQMTDTNVRSNWQYKWQIQVTSTNVIHNWQVQMTDGIYRYSWQIQLKCQIQLASTNDRCVLQI